MTNIYHETLSSEERTTMIYFLEKILNFDETPIHDKFRECKVLTPEYDIILQDVSNIVKRKKEIKALMEMLKD